MIDDFSEVDPKTGICASVVTFYAALYPKLRQVAREHGYALALHGSLSKDLDVVAVPWVEEAAPPLELVKALTEAAGGFVVPGGQYADGAWKLVGGLRPCPKPHGRMVWTIHLGDTGGYIDLSVTPRAHL